MMIISNNTIFRLNSIAVKLLSDVNNKLFYFTIEEALVLVTKLFFKGREKLSSMPAGGAVPAAAAAAAPAAAAEEKKGQLLIF